MKQFLLPFLAILFLSVGAKAQCSATFTYAVTNETVTVDAVGTPTASLAGYGWQWGDGGFGQGQTASHTYTASGTYSVCLTYGIAALPPCTTQVCENITVIVAAVNEYNKSIRRISMSPNPSSSFVKLNYTLTEAGSIEIMLLDITGKIVGVIKNELQEPGNHNTVYDTGDLAKGLYFVRFKNRQATEVRKLIIE